MQPQNIKEHVAQAVIHYLMKRDEDFKKMEKFYLERTSECVDNEYNGNCEKRIIKGEMCALCISCGNKRCKMCTKKWKNCCDYGNKCVVCRSMCSCYSCMKRAYKLHN